MSAELDKFIVKVYTYRKKIGWYIQGYKCVFCTKYFTKNGAPLEKHITTCEMQDARKYRIQRWQEILSLGNKRQTLHKKE